MRRVCMLLYFRSWEKKIDLYYYLFDEMQNVPPSSAEYEAQSALNQLSIR